MMEKSTRTNLIVRTLSGAVLLVLVLAAVLLSRYTFAALLTIICLGAMHEFYVIAERGGVLPQKGYGMVVGVLTVLLSFHAASADDLRLLILLLPLFFVVFFIELYRKRETPLVNIAATLGGAFYVAVPLSLLCFVAFIDGNGYGEAEVISEVPVYQPYVVLSYIFIVWANDIGAYLAGVSLGRHKLFERISPKKTWEGFLGGLVAAVVVGAVAGSVMDHSVLLWAGVACVTVVCGVLGDLTESMFKRSVDLKDSGAIMPGHGGFLDRFDALFLSAPFVFVYFTIFGY